MTSFGVDAYKASEKDLLTEGVKRRDSYGLDRAEVEDSAVKRRGP
jgi:hypothetical protein